MLSRDNAYSKIEYNATNNEYEVYTELLVHTTNCIHNPKQVHDAIEANIKYLLQQVYGDILGELYILSMYMFEDKVKLDSRIQDKVSELIKLCQHAVS